MTAKHAGRESAFEMECPRCQKRHRNWAPGVLYSQPGQHGGPGELRWRPWDLELPPKTRYSRPNITQWSPDYPVEASACLDCGFIVLQLCAADERQLQGAMVRAARDRKGLTQRELALRAKISGGQTGISKFENGRGWLSDEELGSIAELLGIDAAKLKHPLRPFGRASDES